MSDRISIVVIDDHPVFREGVSRVLDSEPGFSVVGEGQCAEDAIRIAAADAPDVMLLDVSMPGGGLAAARTIASQRPNVKIIMLTVVDEDRLVLSALGAGVRGYVLKGVSAPELIRTIRDILDGDRFVSPSLAARILAGRRATDAQVPSHAVAQLSDLDDRILSLIGDGFSPERIARHLALDVRAVHNAIVSLLVELQAERQDCDAMSTETQGRQLH